MELFDSVYDNYHDTLARMVRVGDNPHTPAEIAIVEGIPERLSQMLADLGRDPAQFRIYGGVGQRNFNYAKVPWVAVLDSNVTTSTQRGHFIVLLFKEDMSGCYLSLNQGFTQYRDRFGTDGIATRRIEQTAIDLARFLEVSTPFVPGRIDLAATGPMGRGYALGAIASKFYDRDVPLDDAEVHNDLGALLDLHDRITARVGESVLNYLPGQTEEEFQDAASLLAKSSVGLDETDEPKAPPERGVGAVGGGYRRDPKVAARAIRDADHKCEVGESHTTFISRSTGRNFVEAHHLIPMGRQSSYSTSIDVAANVVALCPNCHRMLHFGKPNAKVELLRNLLEKRLTRLQAAGISINFDALRAHYDGTLLDGD